jgi:hypothetical protein
MTLNIDDLVLKLKRTHNLLTTYKLFQKYPEIKQVKVRFSNQYNDWGGYDEVIELKGVGLFEDKAEEFTASMKRFASPDLNLEEIIECGSGYPQQLHYIEDEEVTYTNPGPEVIESNLLSIEAMLWGINKLNEVQE